MPQRCAQLLDHPFCRTQLCLNLFKNRSNWTNRVTEHRTGATVGFTPTWLSLKTAFVKQYSSPVCRGPYQEDSCLERAIKVRAARQVYCPQQRHCFPKRFLNCWHSSFFMTAPVLLFSECWRAHACSSVCPGTAVWIFFSFPFPGLTLVTSFTATRREA